MTDTDDRVHLLSPPGHSVDLIQLAQAVAPLIGDWPQTLATRIRQGAGIIAENVPASTAATYEAEWLQLSEDPLWRIPADGPVDRPHLRRVVRVDIAPGSEPTPDDASTPETFDLRFPLDDPESVRWSDFACAFVTVWAEESGVDSSASPPERDATSTTVDLLAGQPVEFAAQRAALVQPELNYRQIVLTLARTEPIEFFQIELGTTFPQLVDLERKTSTDVWLAFLGRCVEHIPLARFVPGTREFWDDGDLAGVHCPTRHDYQHRLSWIAEILAHELWEPFR